MYVICMDRFTAIIISCDTCERNSICINACGINVCVRSESPCLISCFHSFHLLRDSSEPDVFMYDGFVRSGIFSMLNGNYKQKYGLLLELYKCDFMLAKNIIETILKLKRKLKRECFK